MVTTSLIENLNFMKSIQTQYHDGEIIALHLTEKGDKFSERYKYNPDLCGVDNHILGCLTLINSKSMVNHYNGVLKPTSYRQDTARGFIFNLTDGD